MPPTLKSLQKLIVGFEKLANPGLSKDDEKYLTYENFSNNHPTLDQVLESTEFPSRTHMLFQDSVFRALRAVNIIQNKELKEVFNFNELLNETAIGQLGEKVHLFSASGKGSVMAINCSTEQLASYFNLSSRIRIGKCVSNYISLYISKTECKKRRFLRTRNSRNRV